ncbi:hypothetical protein [Nocardiopsis dassonvillei]|uniref:hypothetical protein n=1 Tax=Nocardiopsis dassonvillei TaxID=2014 RepID=UPI00157C1CBB|nr:hypothetical protein [Nocardiopsis dassonvillei]
MTEDAGERPIDASDEQALMVFDTGNYATEPNEEQVLRDLYGAPDDDGVYRGVPHDG